MPYLSSVVALFGYVWMVGKWGRTLVRRPHKVRATVTIPVESLRTVSATATIPLPLNAESMPDGVRARYDERRIAGYMVAATANMNGNPLLPGTYQSA